MLQLFSRTYLSGFRDRKCQIEKDVKRTDRNLDFYNGDNNPNIDRLQAILLSYVMYNFDMVSLIFHLFISIRHHYILLCLIMTTGLRTRHVGSALANSVSDGR